MFKLILEQPQLFTDEYFLTNNQLIEEYLVYLHFSGLRSGEKKSQEFQKIVRHNKLKRLLTAAVTLPFWKSRIKNECIDAKDIESMLHFLQVTSKLDLRSVSLEERTNYNIASRYGVITATSGSTGEPLQFFIDRRLRIRQWALMSRVGGLRYFSRRLLVHLWPTQNPNPLFGGHFFSVKTTEELQYQIPDICRLVSQPNSILHGLPSLLRLLSEVAEKSGLALRPQVVITSGEELSPEARTILSEKFHCKVASYYGSRELSVMAGQCDIGRFHENSEDVIFEVVSENGEPLKIGETGRLVVTGLNSYIAPFIRYHLGDYGFFYDDSCPCGNPLPSFNFKGRAHDTVPIILSDGNHIFPYKLTGIFNKRFKKIRQYQIDHYAPNSFLVKVIPTGVFNENDLLELTLELKNITRNGKIVLHCVESIEKNGSKILPYIKSFKD